MLKTALWTVSLTLSMLVNYATAAADAEQVLSSAAKALGAEHLRSIEYSGSGYDFALGQAPNVRSPWPKFNDKAYTRTVNFEPWETRCNEFGLSSKIHRAVAVASRLSVSKARPK
jgi:hypothetical protein